MEDYGKLSRFDQGGINIVTAPRLRLLLKKLAMKDVKLRWLISSPSTANNGILQPFRQFLAKSWTLTAVR
jgi:hypothetical protein